MTTICEKWVSAIIWNFLRVAVLLMFAITPVGMGIISYLIGLATGEDVFEVSEPYSSYLCVRLSGVLDGVISGAEVTWFQSFGSSGNYECDVEFYSRLMR